MLLNEKFKIKNAFNFKYFFSKDIISLLELIMSVGPFNPLVYSNTEITRINFTQTFNPYKFDDIDTLGDGQIEFRRVMNLALRKVPNKLYWYTIEKHPESNRYHMHGQVVIYQEYKYPFDIKDKYMLYDNINGLLGKKIGVRKIRFDKKELGKEREELYPTYAHYCLKEVPSYILVKNGDVSYPEKPSC